MYSHSKKWISEEQKARNKLKAVNKTRNRMFPKSFAWPADFDLTLHHQEMAKLRRERDWTRVMDEARHRRRTSDQMLDDDAPVCSFIGHAGIRPPFDEHQWYSGIYSTVLAQPTIFVPDQCGCGWSTRGMERPPAAWPCKEELHHEGDYRISNEKHLRRMLPAPRMSTNDTVAWSKRSYLQPLPFDDFRIFRMGTEETSEVSNVEGEFLLGSDLFGMLDPVDSL